MKRLEAAPASKQLTKKALTGKTQSLAQFNATASAKNPESDAQLLQKKMLETILAMQKRCD